MSDIIVSSTIDTFMRSGDQASARAALGLSDVLPVIQSVTFPFSGATIICTDSSADSTLNITPAGTLAALTVTLPTEANSRIGQIQRITTAQAITALTINGATTIRGNITTGAVGGFVSFQKIAANTWARIS